MRIKYASAYRSKRVSQNKEVILGAFYSDRRMHSAVAMPLSLREISILEIARR